MPKVKIISVVSCELGQGGFAQALQRDLFEFGQIKATLYTRNLPVRVDEAGFKETYLPGSASEFQPKRMGAKAEWFWQGNSQLSRPVAARVK